MDKWVDEWVDKTVNEWRSVRIIMIIVWINDGIALFTIRSQRPYSIVCLSACCWSLQLTQIVLWWLYTASLKSLSLMSATLSLPPLQYLLFFNLHLSLFLYYPSFLYLSLSFFIIMTMKMRKKILNHPPCTVLLLTFPRGQTVWEDQQLEVQHVMWTDLNLNLSRHC